MTGSFKKQFALFKQTMICDNRDLSAASLRGLTVTSFFLGFILQHWDYMGSAKGMQALEMTFGINLFLLPVASVALFLPVIMEERKNQSMGLLLMTGLESWGYIVGRCGSRFVQLMMLICLQIPFNIIAVALGGITIAMVLKVYLYLFALAFLVSNLYIFCSLFFSHVFKGILASSAIVLVLIFSYYLVIWSHDYNNSNYYYSMSFERMLENSFEAIYVMGFEVVTRNWGGGLKYYWLYVTMFAVTGLIFLAITLLYFSRKSMDIASYDFIGGCKDLSDQFIPKKITKRERFSVTNPVFTKDYYYIMHGRFLTIFQAVVLLGITAWALSEFYSLRGVIEVSIASSFFSLLIIAWYTGNRIWYEEIQAQTFNALKGTPREMENLLFQKNTVAIRCLIPSAICITLFVGYYLMYERSYYHSGIFPVGFFFITMVPASYFLSSYLSLFLQKMRYLVSAGSCILIFIIEVIIIDASRAEDAVFFFIGVVHVVLSAILNACCLSRVREKYLE